MDLSRPSELLPEPMFLRALCLERKRAERSGNRFLLMLVEFDQTAENGAADRIRGQAISAVLGRIRETDICGWYAANTILGVIFTELGDAKEANEPLALPILRARLTTALDSSLTPEERRRLGLSFHWFPDDALADRAEQTMYPDLTQRDASKKVERFVKRVIDVVGSVLALTVLSPCFLAIAAGIRLSSPGPIFFRQQRLGRYGVPFTFLKFRSMHEIGRAHV